MYVVLIIIQHYGNRRNSELDTEPSPNHTDEMKPGKSETTFQSVWLYKPLIVILCSFKHSLNWSLHNNKRSDLK